MKKYFITMILIICAVFSNAQINFQIDGDNEMIEDFDTYLNTSSYYYNSSTNGVSDNLTIEIEINGIPLPNGTNVFIRLKKPSELGNIVVFTSPIPLVVAGGIVNQDITVNGDIAGLTGVYEVELMNAAGTRIETSLNQGIYIVVEKTKTINILGAHYDFRIRWCDDFFATPADAITFINQTEIALNAVWQKEVNDWGLCDDLTPAIPENSSNYYEILINPLKDFTPDNWFIYRKSSDNISILNNNIRKIEISAKVMDYLGLTAIGIGPLDQQNFLYEFYSHEFLHGIQASYINFDLITVDDIKKNQWLWDGQAKFIETISLLVPETNNNFAFGNVLKTKDINGYIPIANGPNSYADYTNNYLFDNYWTNYQAKSLNTVAYEYCMFWRHLWEQNFLPGTDDDVRMELLRLTMQNNISVLLPNIETMMTDQLAEVEGTFTTFDKALIDFAENAYFHENAYDNASNTNSLRNATNSVPLWDDPQGNDFYGAITTFNWHPVEHDYAGGAVYNSPIFTIPSAFASRVNEFSFSKNQVVKFELNKDPILNGLGDFNVEYYLINTSVAAAPVILKDKTLTFVGATGADYIEITDFANEKLVFIVTRLDPSEVVGNLLIEYSIEIEEQVIDFTINPAPDATSVLNNLGELITFTDISAGAPVTRNWIIKEGTTILHENDGANTQYTFNDAGEYNISLNVTYVAGGDIFSISKDIILGGMSDDEVVDFQIDNNSDDNITISNLGGVVDFESLADGTPSSWQWEISDASGIIQSNITENTQYTFTDEGNYSASLKVKYCNTCSDYTRLKNFTIGPVAGQETVNFQVYDGITDVTLMAKVKKIPYTLTDNSIGTPTSWKWEISKKKLFNEEYESIILPVDNTSSINYTFPHTGDYKIKLIVNYGGADYSNTAIPFEVLRCPPDKDGPSCIDVEADFYALNTLVTVNTPVTFTDASYNAVSWDWTFDNGTTPPITWDGQKPEIIFTENGIYNVTLEVYNSAGQKDTYTQYAYITVNLPDAFTDHLNIKYLFGTTSLQFVCESEKSPVSWHWDIYNLATGVLINSGSGFTIDIGNPTFDIKATVTVGYPSGPDGTRTEQFILTKQCD